MSKLCFLCLFVVLMVSCEKKPGQPATPPIPNNKALAWINTFGGTNNDFSYAAVQTADSNFVFAGASRSTDGDVPGNRIGYDAWMSKIDKAGSKIWSKTFGENNDDFANSVITTSDGGFMLAGYTFIGNTNNTAWIIKTDGNGNQQWRKDFTENVDAKAQFLLATADGNFLLVGHSFTNTTKYDGWIIKLDGAGNRLWTKNYGGSQDDYASSVVRANDGGYVVSGYTRSADGDISRSNGAIDGWAIKIDESGNRLWSKNFGGTKDDYVRTIVRTSDNGYMLAGHTNSTDGDITGSKGSIDEWLIKIDGAGNKQWSKNFGGANDDYANGLVATRDGGYMLSGYTNSTNADVTRNAGDFGGWLIKIDGAGNKLAVSTYGNTFDDFTSSVINTLDGGYLMAGFTSLNNTNSDAWLVKVLDLQ